MDITSYVLGKKAGGGSSPAQLQSKEITITENGEQTITPDSGYDGLRRVDITTNVSGGGKYSPQIIQFQGFTGTSLDNETQNLDTSNITNMENMFERCSNLTTLDLSGFDTSNVTNMYSMFGNCKSLTNLDISNFNTTALTNVRSMFQYCENLGKITLGENFKKDFTKMDSLFSNCKNLETIDLENLKLDKADSTANMFNNCKKLKRIDLSEWKCPSENACNTSLMSMFNGCTDLEEVVLSHPEGQSYWVYLLPWSTSNRNSSANMFYGCTSLKSFLNYKIYGDIQYMQNMFYGCTSLENVEFGNIYFGKATNLQNMFYGCTNLSDTALNNILNKLSTASNLSSANKKLSYVGITDSTLLSKIPNLSNYQAFINAGWTIS